MHGKSLKLTYWMLGDKGERIETRDPFVIPIPTEKGACVGIHPTTLRLHGRGYYWVELVDSEGAFKNAGELLATYFFWSDG